MAVCAVTILFWGFCSVFLFLFFYYLRCWLLDTVLCSYHLCHDVDVDVSIYQALDDCSLDCWSQ